MIIKIIHTSYVSYRWIRTSSYCSRALVKYTIALCEFYLRGIIGRQPPPPPWTSHQQPAKKKLTKNVVTQEKPSVVSAAAAAAARCAQRPEKIIN